MVNVDGKKKQAELVLTYKAPNGCSYVIYNLEGKSYGAKYTIVNGNTILDAALSLKEKEMLNNVFKEARGK